MRKKMPQDYLRSIVFGFEDALVSTTGVVVGISAGTTQKEFILLASLVTVIVEAVSMAAGQYLSEKAVHEEDKHHEHKDSLFFGAALMLFSYLLGGALPILPVLFFSGFLASLMSILLSFFGLFILGFFKGKYLHKNPMRSAAEMLLIGGVAALLGIAVGRFIKIR